VQCCHDPELKPHLAGAKKLIAKIKEFNPKIAVFNGKGIYEVFSGQKEFIFGKQPEKIRGTETVSCGQVLAGGGEGEGGS
jgi:mismatch-specific thymine-DNA glycosylase